MWRNGPRLYWQYARDAQMDLQELPGAMDKRGTIMDDQMKEWVARLVAQETWSFMLSALSRRIPKTQSWTDLKQEHVGTVLCELLRMAAKDGLAVTGDDRADT
jgi:hypothetical protein